MATYDASVTLEAQSSAIGGISERTVDSERGIVDSKQFLGPDTAFYASYSGIDVVISGLSGAFNGTYALVEDANYIATGLGVWTANSN